MGIGTLRRHYKQNGVKFQNEEGSVEPTQAAEVEENAEPVTEQTAEPALNEPKKTRARKTAQSAVASVNVETPAVVQVEATEQKGE